MKPTFRKVYSAPGYWVKPKPLPWSLIPDTYHAGRNPLARAGMAEVNERFGFERVSQVPLEPFHHHAYSNPANGYYTIPKDFPVRCWDWRPVTICSAGPVSVEEMLRIYGMSSYPTGRHEGDCLRLPLGASIRPG